MNPSLFTFYYLQAQVLNPKAWPQSKTKIVNLINHGTQQNIISESDAKTMEPNGKPGKLYGIPKLHKGIQEGKRLPPCRPIVSNSGSNTEYIYL